MTFIGFAMRVSEVFYSLQGEGRHAGIAAFFVRLAGCDVGCEWCDSREAWGGGSEMSVREIAESAATLGAETVIITGGEPLMQNLDELCAEFHSRNIRVHLETSGTHPLSGRFDWVTLSPKRHRQPIFFGADELKVVITSAEDFEWAEECAGQPGG